MVARTIIVVVALAALGCGEPAPRGISQGSFRVDSPGLHFDLNATALINLALNDWFSSKQTADVALDYLLEKPLTRIALCKSGLPKAFEPHLFGAKAYVLDDRRATFSKGELCIRIDAYTVAADGTTTVTFVHMGKGIMGGMWVTYVMRDRAGLWAVDKVDYFDP